MYIHICIYIRVNTYMLAFYMYLCMYTYGMGWLRLVGSLKLEVCFAKEPYKRDYILEKGSIVLRGLLIVATPYL